MPLAGKGMLLTSMDIDPSDEAEFNRWYDREHLEERVAIPGFLEARRYVAHDGKPKYLSLYSTETFEVLDSPAYRTALANQTAWSKANIARFKNMIRGVARITISRGQGRGAALGIVRLAPPAGTRISCVPHCGINSIRQAGRDHLDASARERSFAVQADHRRSLGAQSRRRRLVRADRRHRCRARCRRFAARLANAAIKSAWISTGLYRSDVGSGEERPSEDLNAALNCAAHAALPHISALTLSGLRLMKAGDETNWPLCSALEWL